MNQTDDALRHAHNIYKADQVAQQMGIELVDAGEGTASARMLVRPDMLNGAGTCHGGVVFMLADVAFQCACNSHGRLTVSAASTIEFVRPAVVGDELTAICQERYRNRSGGGYDVTVNRTARAGASHEPELVALFRGQAHELKSSH